jgi:UDP-N-acetylmuramoyl-L-alanyl-D-glutamate--2,6-diaminopimelate ligase
VILTDDNPRNEDGDRIIADMLIGIPGTCRPVIERDRAKAIRDAVIGADPRDTVLIAGKGHETYQEVRGVRRPFSDVAVVREALQERLR